MTKESVKVLILEDDDSVAESLQAVFSRYGFSITIVKNPSDALLALKNNSFNYAFVDCMLPEQNGVDFVAANSELFRQNNTEVVLMSGVLTDSALIKYSKAKARAIDFMVKPFSLDQILKIIRRDVARVENTLPRKKLYSIFQDERLSDRDKKRILLLQDELEALDLITLICLAIELKLSGYLNLEWGDRSKASIGFSSGLVTTVELDDLETKIGSLLLKNQFVLPEDLNEVLNSPHGSGRLGQRLIQANKLSPHAFDEVFLLQMKIRLSKILTFGPVRVNFADAEIEIQGVYLSTDDLFKELEQWVKTELSVEFVESLLKTHSAQHFVKSAYFRIDHPVFSIELVRGFPEFLAVFDHEVSLEKILAKTQSRDNCLRAIYLLLVKGLIYATSREEKNIASVHTSESQGLSVNLPPAKGLDSKDPFEPLNRSIDDSSVDLEITKPSIKILHEEVDSQIGDDTSANLESAISSQPKFESEKVGNGNALDLNSMNADLLQANSVCKSSETSDLDILRSLQDIEKFLLESKFDEAHESIQLFLAKNSDSPELYLFQAWVQLGRIESSINRLQSFKSIDSLLLKVPKSNTESANYYFVKSLLLKLRQNYYEAKEFLVKAMHLNPQNMVIKRELMQVNAILQSQLSLKIKSENTKENIGDVKKRKI